MRLLRVLTIAFFLNSAISTFAAVEMPAKSYLKGLTWLGHASFRLSHDGQTIYLDPWKLTSEPHDADLVLITHPHFDHCDAESVKKVSKATTILVAPKEAIEKLKGEGVTAKAFWLVEPGSQNHLRGIQIQAVLAYNTNKTFHLKESKWVGFLIEWDGVRYYHAGDTDSIPEMKDLHVDVALLPVSGTYVMTAQEAAEAARIINPKVAVPMHYGSLVGSKADAERFKEFCGGVVVEILEEQR